ncbi:MAG: cyclodeaminase/cyclohydrolase family protein [Sphingorhabdus sp.]
MPDRKNSITPLIRNSADALLKKFGEGNATPGSGSAAAFMGLLSCSMILAVVRKSKTKSVKISESRLDFIEERTIKADLRLKDLFQKDSDEFEEVVRLRREREEAKNEQQARLLQRRAIDRLEETNKIIFEIAETCLELVDYATELFEVGWPHVRGDSGAGISSAISGAMSCIFVANLNLKKFERRLSAAGYAEKIEGLTNKISASHDKALSCISQLSSEADVSPTFFDNR